MGCTGKLKKSKVYRETKEYVRTGGVPTMYISGVPTYYSFGCTDDEHCGCTDYLHF